MHHSFWSDKWRKGEIGFHQYQIHPALIKYFPKLPQNSNILVPLCGKSMDMLWLANQGYKVTGVELVESAVIEFFEDNNLEYVRDQQDSFIHYRAKEWPIHLIAGDFFALDGRHLKKCDALYDRAALVALPIEMRSDYVKQCQELLLDTARILLISFSYDQSAMQGPPFSVDEGELNELWEGRLHLLESFNLLRGESKFRDRGLTYMDEQTWSN